MLRSNRGFAHRPIATLLLVVAAAGCAPDPGLGPGAQSDGPTPTAFELTPTTFFRTDFAPPEGRALALEDYYGIPSVGSPSLSPNAEWVAFTVSVDVEDAGSESEAWVVPFDGSAEARRVSPSGVDVGGVRWTDEGRLRWSADGTRWSVDPAAPGTPPDPDRDPPEADDEDRGLPSPDGRWFADLRDMPPPEPPEEQVSDFIRRHEERFEGAVWDWMNFQRDGRDMPIPDATDPRVNPAREIFLVPGPDAAEGAEERQLTSLGHRPGNLTWSPDGSFLVFTSDPTYRDELTYGRSDLWRLDLDGTLTRLAPEDHWSNSGPEFSPDGRYIAFGRSYSTDHVIAERLSTRGPDDLWILDVPTGEIRNLTDDFGLDAGNPEWTPDSRWLYFTTARGGATHLYRVPAEGGPVEQITTGERRIQSLDHDEAFTRMVYRVGTLEAPPEIYSANMDGSDEHRLTRVLDGFKAEVTLSEGEHLVFESPDGTPIEGWLLYPYGYDPAGGPYPLIVHSHGGPHSASGYSFSFKHHYFAANGYFVLQTNFRGSSGYGEAFEYATWGAWGDRDGEDVMAGVDFVLEHFPVDPARVATIGHSYGGFMSNWLIARYPDRFAAAAVGAGISNWVSDYGTADIAVTKETEFYGPPWVPEALERLMRQSPLVYADRVRAATLFLHGEVDHRVPFPEAEQMYFAIKKQGVPAKMIMYEGQSHGGWGDSNNVHRMYHELKWFDEHLSSR